MDRGQEQTTEDNALLHESGQQPEADVPEDGLQVSFVQIQIERHHGPRVGKRAVVYCDLDESQMTEACVRELGFSLQTRAGQNRRRLRLLLGAPGEPHLFKVTFKIVAEADHDISLNEAASDKLHESSRGANYTVFAVPVSRTTRQKRIQDRKDRLEREKHATEEKMNDELQRGQREQASKPTPGAVARQ